MVSAAVCAVVAGYRSYTAIAEWVDDVPADTWITFTTLPPSSVADGEHDRPVH